MPSRLFKILPAHARLGPTLYSNLVCASNTPTTQQSSKWIPSSHANEHLAFSCCLPESNHFLYQAGIPVALPLSFPTGSSLPSSRVALLWVILHHSILTGSLSMQGWCSSALHSMLPSPVILHKSGISKLFLVVIMMPVSAMQMENLTQWLGAYPRPFVLCGSRCSLPHQALACCSTQSS